MRWAYFDVDNTLILWDEAEPSPDRVQFQDPFNPDRFWDFGIHRAHVELLKLIAERGDTVVVWSAAGLEWAETVVEALDLWDHVSYILQKPDSLFDDERKDLIIPEPRWLKP